MEIPQPKYKAGDTLYFGYRQSDYPKCPSCGHSKVKEKPKYHYKTFQFDVSSVIINIEKDLTYIEYVGPGGMTESEEELFSTPDEAINALKERDKNNG